MADANSRIEHPPAWADYPDYPQYFDESGLIQEIYVDELALSIAIRVTRDGLTKHQLRAVFGEVKRVQAIYRATKDFAAVRYRLARLKPYANARHARDKLPTSFQDFIGLNVDKATDADSLEAFVQHFEAVTAYCEGRL